MNVGTISAHTLGVDRLDLRGKRVLLRADFSVPRVGETIGGDAPIRAVLPIAHGRGGRALRHELATPVVKVMSSDAHDQITPWARPTSTKAATARSR